MSRSTIEKRVFINFHALICVLYILCAVSEKVLAQGKHEPSDPTVNTIKVDDEIAWVVAAVLDETTLKCRDFTKTTTPTTLVRIYGIACPKKGQAFGEEASAFITQAVLNRRIRIRVKAMHNDGVIVGQVTHAADKDLASELVQAGLAWCLVPPPDDGVLSGYEKEARAGKRGLWVNASPTPPWQFDLPATSSTQVPAPRRDPRETKQGYLEVRFRNIELAAEDYLVDHRRGLPMVDLSGMVIEGSGAPQSSLPPRKPVMLLDAVLLGVMPDSQSLSSDAPGITRGVYNTVTRDWIRFAALDKDGKGCQYCFAPRGQFKDLFLLLMERKAVVNLYGFVLKGGRPGDWHGVFCERIDVVRLLDTSAGSAAPSSRTR